MKHLDCRGLACPGPVIQVKKTLEETSPGGSFSIELDSESSRDNVRRFAESRGAEVQVEERMEGGIRLVITAPAEKEKRGKGEKGKKPPVVFITAETIGDGDKKLGRILMEGFISTLLEQDSAPDRILLMNAGVKLAVQGSPVLKALEEITNLGCEILVCGTCLKFFSLTEKLSVGTVSNMYDIQGVLLSASSVVRI